MDYQLWISTLNSLQYQSSPWVAKLKHLARLIYLNILMDRAGPTNYGFEYQPVTKIGISSKLTQISLEY